MAWLGRPECFEVDALLYYGLGEGRSHNLHRDFTEETYRHPTVLCLLADDESRLLLVGVEVLHILTTEQLGNGFVGLARVALLGLIVEQVALSFLQLTHGQFSLQTLDVRL